MKICATIVTYNRKECLDKLLNALSSQTYPIEKILIFDNNSSDGTVNYLENTGFTVINNREELYPFDHKTKKIVIANDENLGGSGGFASVIDSAKVFDDIDTVWIMDDDVLPDKNCLELLVQGMEDTGASAVIPNRDGDNFKERVCYQIDFRSIMSYEPSSRKKFVARPFDEKYYQVDDMSFEGPLISMDILKKSGTPDSGYFLQYDDSDYARRVLKYTQIYFVTNANLHRQLSKLPEENPKPKPYTWRDYYILRNNIIFDRKFGLTKGVRIISPRLLLVRRLLSSIKNGFVKENFPIIWKAYNDGIHHKMGKRMDPNY